MYDGHARDFRRIAEIEFGDLVADSQPLGEKLRLHLSDGSYVDLWLSRRLHERFGFPWERRHLDGTFYRYDNFPNTAWRDVVSYPHHFHIGSQDAVTSTPFATDPADSKGARPDPARPAPQCVIMKPPVPVNSALTGTGALGQPSESLIADAPHYDPGASRKSNSPRRAASA